MLKAKAGASAPKSLFAQGSLSSSTWAKWLASRSSGEFTWSDITQHISVVSHIYFKKFVRASF